MLNQEYNDSKSEIISVVNSTEKIDILDSLKKNKFFKIDDTIQLSEDFFIIDEVACDGCYVSSNKDMIASINIELNDTLINEGMVRDLIRKIQNLRKDSDFRVDDRIDISLVSDKRVYDAIKVNEEYLLNEVLGINLTFDKCESDFTLDVIVYDMKVKLGISKNNK